MIQYTLYVIEPLVGGVYTQLTFGYFYHRLQSDVSGFYKYRIDVIEGSDNDIFAPIRSSKKLPFLIVSDKGFIGFSTSSTFVKGHRKYIYNPKYSITTKQPYRQLKEHLALYKAELLIDTL